MKQIVLGLVVIIILIVLAMLVLSGREDRSAAQVASVSTSTIAESSDTYSISLAYPKFGVQKIDSQIQSVIDKAVNDFKALPPNPTPTNAKNELVGEYQVINPGPDFLSAKLEIYQFTGGAHGLTVTYGLNFHPDGTRVTLDEAVSLTGKSLEQISEEAQKQLQARFGLVQFPEGAAPNKENYSIFVIGTSTVTFIFQQYQVEAYAAGMPEVVFPQVK